MDPILAAFILLTFIMILAWAGKYRLSMTLFIIFLIFLTLVFAHNVTDKLLLNF